ncbi:uncharacterized protein EAF02_006536 [Botrytis sinoallii]|uniref:uncharacterized protein n=1 Tax=Botrytis sinoallii TaxID=1463999 RepID=UPI0018FF8617|nr:uncharacterized protein EAF02_006536 [Botrytis sinoallii]KAF7881848.1 hypothetical protein EAF02_006536 [Botrytis sinoallii]
MSGSFPVDFPATQFTFNMTAPTTKQTSAPGKVGAPGQSALNLADPLSARFRNLQLDPEQHAQLVMNNFGDLHLDRKQPGSLTPASSRISSHDANEFDEDFEEAWEEQTPNIKNESTPPTATLLSDIQLAMQQGLMVNCIKCRLPNTYKVSQVWLPNPSQPELIAPDSANTKSHLHIAACAKCSFGTCLDCGVAPHLKECTFSDTRAAWEALSAVDDAVINFRNESPHLPLTHATRELLPALLKCLTTLNTTVARNGAITFGFDQLLRKSMLLDLVADFMRGMTAQTMELTPLLVQVLEFLHMLAENAGTRKLFFEKRQVLKTTSPGLQTLAFPLVLLPVQQVSAYNWSDREASTYTLWPLLQKSLKAAQQYMLENHDDVWSAALVALAQRVPDVYALVASSVPPKPLKLTYTHYTQHELGYAIGLRELFTVAVAKKSEAKKVAATQEDTSKMEVDPPLKKRGRARVRAEAQDVDEDEASRWGKRRTAGKR